MEELVKILGPLTPLVATILLATANSEIVDYIKRPIEKRFPKADLWWFVYVGFITGLGIGILSGINLFEGIVEVEILGKILTGALIGGGSTLIYRVFKRADPPIGPG